MKKKTVICITLMILLNSLIDADEIKLSELNDDMPKIYLINKKHTLLEASFRIFYPPNNEFNFSFFNIGYGWNYDINKNIFSPGILFDLSIGTDWLWLFNKEKDVNDTTVHNQFGLGAGIKIYNMIEINEFRIIPFIGCNFLFFYKPCPMFGLSLSYKIIGLEYAYYFPLGAYKTEANHHISIKVMVKDY